MWNTGLDEAQAGIKIAGRNTNNFSYADDTMFMAESEELNSLLIKVKESENVDLKLNIQKTKIMDPVPSWDFMENRWGNNGNSGWLYFLGSKITADGDCNHEIKRCLLFGR